MYFYVSILLPIGMGINCLVALEKEAWLIEIPCYFHALEHFHYYVFLHIMTKYYYYYIILHHYYTIITVTVFCYYVLLQSHYYIILHFCILPILTLLLCIITYPLLLIITNSLSHHYYIVFTSLLCPSGHVTAQTMSNKQAGRQLLP